MNISAILCCSVHIAGSMQEAVVDEERQATALQADSLREAGR